MTKQQAIEGSQEALREYMRATDIALMNPEVDEIPADVAAFLTEKETTHFMVEIALYRQLDVALISGGTVTHFVGEPLVSNDLQQVTIGGCLDGSSMRYTGEVGSVINSYATVTYQADYVAPTWMLTRIKADRAESC